MAASNQITTGEQRVVQVNALQRGHHPKLLEDGRVKIFASKTRREIGPVAISLTGDAHTSLGFPDKFPAASRRRLSVSEFLVAKKEVTPQYLSQYIVRHFTLSTRCYPTGATEVVQGPLSLLVNC